MNTDERGPGRPISFAVQEAFQNLNILFWLFIRGQVAALLKEDELGAGDSVGQSPGGKWSDVHVIAAGDYKLGKFKAGKFGCEVKIGGGLGNGFSYGRVVAEVTHMAYVGVALLRGVKDHAEMIAQAGAGRGFGLWAKLLRFLLVLFLYIGKDVGQHMDDIVPGRPGRVREDQFGDVFRMSGGIGHGDESAIRVTEQSKFGEAEGLAHGIEISDLRVHGLIRTGLQ